jgi:hypothetical protein
MADDLSPQDRDLVARTMLSEGAVDGDSGMAAVAAVIKNRANSGSDFPTKISDIVHQPGAFSAWDLPRKDPNHPMNYGSQNPNLQHAALLADSIFSGKTPDPTNGATYYANVPAVQANLRPGQKMPPFTQYPQTAQIGHHTFFSPDAPDALSSWNKAVNAPAQAAPSAATAEQAKDPLARWNAAVNPSDASLPARSPLQITIHPQNPVLAGGEETPAQWTNRVLSEHQADTPEDMAVRFGLGTLHGVGTVADTLAQGIAGAGAAGAGALSSIGAISPTTNDAMSKWAAGVNARVAAGRAGYEPLAANSPLTQIGNIAGQVIGTGPLLGGGGALATRAGIGAGAGPVESMLMTGAGAGAGASALTSSASDESLPVQMATGGIAGAALGPAGMATSRLGAGARRLFVGGLDPETAMLAQTARNAYDIPVTAGQMSSSQPVRFLDSVLQRLPFSGYAARTAEQQTGLNRAVASEMGVTADKITPDVLKQAKSTAYNDYDAAKTNLGNLTIDKPFFSDLQNVYDNAHYNLEAPQAKLIDKHLQNVFDKIDPKTNTIDPDLYQSLTRKGGPLDKAINQGDPKLATYAADIKDSLENLVGRNDPNLKKLKDAADYKYFVAKSLETGPENLISPTGDVNPARLYGAVDRSQTPIGTLGQIGKRFMREPPSSGTAERLLTMGGIGAGLGALGVGGYEFDPEHFQRNAALAASALALGRGASAALRSGTLANSLIRSGLPRAGGSYPLANLLSRAAPAAALTYRNANGLPGQ